MKAQQDTSPTLEERTKKRFLSAKIKIAFVIQMGTKTISIREDVYETLKSMKREDESISDAVERLITKRKETDLADFFGVLKDSEVLKELEEDMKKIRAASRFRI
ncbi:putative antitoxin, CopG family [Candidatus Methanophagaceae archaeon]|nr:putative antitoxin, CopG family [Methanophagales archaeon]